MSGMKLGSRDGGERKISVISRREIWGREDLKNSKMEERVVDGVTDGVTDAVTDAVMLMDDVKEGDVVDEYDGEMLIESVTDGVTVAVTDDVRDDDNLADLVADDVKDGEGEGVVVTGNKLSSWSCS